MAKDINISIKTLNELAIRITEQTLQKGISNNAVIEKIAGLAVKRIVAESMENGDNVPADFWEFMGEFYSELNRTNDPVEQAGYYTQWLLGNGVVVDEVEEALREGCTEEELESVLNGDEDDFGAYGFAHDIYRVYLWFKECSDNDKARGIVPSANVEEQLEEDAGQTAETTPVKFFRITEKGTQGGVTPNTLSNDAKVIERHHYNDGFELSVYPTETPDVVKIYGNSIETIDWFADSYVKYGQLEATEMESKNYSKEAILGKISKANEEIAKLSWSNGIGEIIDKYFPEFEEFTQEQRDYIWEKAMLKNGQNPIGEIAGGILVCDNKTRQLTLVPITTAEL